MPRCFESLRRRCPPITSSLRSGRILTNMIENCRIKSLCLSLGLGFLAGPSMAIAQQDVFAPLPTVPLLTPQPFGVPMVADPSQVFAPSPESPFEWGSFVLRPHFLY